MTSRATAEQMEKSCQDVIGKLLSSERKIRQIMVSVILDDDSGVHHVSATSPGHSEMIGRQQVIMLERMRKEMQI